MAAPPAYHESLPYIDAEPTASSLDAARALIAAEQATLPARTPPASAEPNFSPAIQTELARIPSQAPLNPLVLSRYEAQEAPPPKAPAEDHRHVLESAYVSNAYLSARLENLQLLEKSGRNAWLIGNHQLEAELRSLEDDLAQTKKDIDLVNIERQRRQEEVRLEMQVLDETWRNGVGKVLETEIAVEALKDQIRNELRSRAEQKPEAPE